MHDVTYKATPCTTEVWGDFFGCQMNKKTRIFCLFWEKYNIDKKSFYEQKSPLKIHYIWNECKATSQEGTVEEN